MNNQKRKTYWNKDYFNYWKKRVEEANQSQRKISEVIKRDYKAPDDNIYLEMISKVKIREGNLLEAGCGWGRLFNLLSEYNLKIYAIDISEKMVKEAKKNKTNKVVEIKEAEIENIPYGNEMFNYVVCLATFDATYQEDALKEMLRVLRLKGKLLFTGKHRNYYPDDEQAKLAEIGAKKKGHPNFFTDVADLKNQLLTKGHKIIYENYFLRRGDMAKYKSVEKMPERFYEYFLIIQKDSDECHFTTFSYPCSCVK